MKRLLRRTFNGLAAASLALFAATCVSWARSYKTYDFIARRDHAPLRAFNVVAKSDGGVLEITSTTATVQDPALDRVPPAVEIAFMNSPPGVNWERYQTAAWPRPPEALPWWGVKADHYGSAYRIPESGWSPFTLSKWRILLPYRSLAAVAALPSVAWVFAWTMRRRRIAPGLCPRCGYDLRATPGRCPERGTSAPPVTPTTPQ